MASSKGQPVRAPIVRLFVLSALLTAGVAGQRFNLALVVATRKNDSWQPPETIHEVTFVENDNLTAVLNDLREASLFPLRLFVRHVAGESEPSSDSDIELVSHDNSTSQVWTIVVPCVLGTLLLAFVVHRGCLYARKVFEETEKLQELQKKRVLDAISAVTTVRFSVCFVRFDKLKQLGKFTQHEECREKVSPTVYAQFTLWKAVGRQQSMC